MSGKSFSVGLLACFQLTWVLGGSLLLAEPLEEDYFESEVLKGSDRERPPSRRKVSPIIRSSESSPPVVTKPSGPVAPGTPHQPPDSYFDVSFAFSSFYQATHRDGRYFEMGFVRPRLGMEASKKEWNFVGDGSATVYKTNLRDREFNARWLDGRHFDNPVLSGETRRTSNSVEYGNVRNLYLEYRTAEFQLSAGRRYFDWAYSDFYDPLNVFNNRRPEDLDSQKYTGNNGLFFAWSPRERVEVSAYVMANQSLPGSAANGAYQDGFLRLQIAPLEDRDFEVTALMGWKARRAVAGMEFSGLQGRLEYRAGFLYLSSYHRDRDDPTIVDEPVFSRENVPFGQSIVSLEYHFARYLSLGIYHFYNGGAGRFFPVRSRLLESAGLQDSERPSRMIYDLRRGHLDTYNPHQVGPGLTGQIRSSYSYQFYIIADPQGQSTMARLIVSYHYGELLMFHLGGLAYGGNRQMESDYGRKAGEAFFSFSMLFY
ncbi:MAG: hypothetical protein HS115_13330 [Spirochaetales bacterium]|nr:hypothetical protein [Spirochaetales bacterium]